MTGLQKKTSRALRAELVAMLGNCERGLERAEQAAQMSEGVLDSLRASEASARTSLQNNARTAAIRHGGVHRPVADALTAVLELSKRSHAELSGYLSDVRTHQALLREVHGDLLSHLEAREQELVQLSDNGLRGQRVELSDANSRDCIAIASQREDAARRACTTVVHMVREALSDLNIRKSAIQEAVRATRAKERAESIAVRHQNFGFSGVRETNPAVRQLPLSPNDGSGVRRPASPGRRPPSPGRRPASPRGRAPSPGRNQRPESPGRANPVNGGSSARGKR